MINMIKGRHQQEKGYGYYWSQKRTYSDSIAMTPVVCGFLRYVGSCIVM